MASTLPPPRLNERGSILVAVAVCLVGLIAFSALVVDYGVLWVSRTQAQAAADAGALAGAISLAANSPNADAEAAALQYAQRSAIWGEFTAPSDIVVSSLPYPCPASAGGGNKCIRVDVMRGAADADGNAHTNSLPVFFASLVGLTEQGVRATATAQASAGNATTCIKPWAIADKWFDTTANGWDQTDAFTPASGDVYRPPSDPSPTGFSLQADKGYQLALKAGDIGTWSSGWAREIDFPGYPGSNNYRDAIAGCPDWIPLVGLYAGQECNDPGDTDPLRGCLGVKTGMSQGPTTQGVNDLTASDPDAYWNGTKVVSEQAISPRIVPISLFHTSDFVSNSSSCGGTNCMVKVINIMGFFVEGMCDEVLLDPGTECGSHPNKTVVGRIITYVGQVRSGSGSAPGTFLQVPRLVR